MQLDLDDAETLALLNPAGRGDRSGPLPAVTAHPDAAPDPGEVRADGTGASSSGPAADTAGTGPRGDGLEHSDRGGDETTRLRSRQPCRAVQKQNRGQQRSGPIQCTLSRCMVSTWTQRSFCHSSNLTAPVFALMRRAITMASASFFTSYALDLKHIEGDVQVTASIKRHWQRASSAIAGGSTRDPSSGGKRISLSPLPIY
jgi:hypothetical protein